jgi:hypothetical protein
MKAKFLLIVLISIFTINLTTAQKSNKEDIPPKTYELTYKGTKYTIKEGDTVYLGFGSNPYGSFMYFKYGGDKSLPKEVGGKIAVITKIIHYKVGSIDRFMMKTTSKPPYMFYTDDLNQSISKQEIIGINDVKFHE